MITNRQHRRVVDAVERLAAMKYSNPVAEDNQRMFFEVCETGKPFVYKGRTVQVVDVANNNKSASDPSDV